MTTETQPASGPTPAAPQQPAGSAQQSAREADPPRRDQARRTPRITDWASI